ncbi:hypothetical protein [Olivibacter jilunii]|uniref:hypothetical protein n=1 Tax=Olivibacter jilunii TaxID=985016 RepID=UPI0010305268|nr:hypothetical protein [Olivibacter jilunii]
MKFKDFKLFTLIDEQNRFVVSYCVEGVEKIQLEAYMNNGELVFVLKILDEALRCKGIGREVFLTIVEKFGSDNIRSIRGSWHADAEFSEFEDGMSTNLLIFKSKLGIFTPEEAAFCTPTGKWAGSIGFQKVKVLVNTVKSVEVQFLKG